MTEIAKIFEALRQGAPTKAGRAYRVFEGPEGSSIVAFVDGLSRLPGLECRYRVGSIPKDFRLPSMRGAVLSRYAEATDDRGLVVLELEASSEEHVEVFIELASRLIHDVESAPSAIESLRRLERRLHAWIRFFAARSDGGLSRSSELGLLGELFCLDQLSGLIGLQAAVFAWVGPTGGAA